MNAEGLQTRRGAEWRDVNVGRLLDCESARGRYPIGKTTKDTSGKRVDLPPEDWVYLPCPELIPSELWEQAQQLLSGSGRAGRSRPPKQLFSGLLVCECGTKLRFVKQTAKFVCASCNGKIAAEELERMFASELKDILFPALARVSSDPKETARAQARQKIAEIETQMSSLEELHAAGKLSLERFGERHTPLDAQRKKLRKSMSDGSTSTTPQSDSSIDWAAFAQRWPSLPHDGRLKLIQTLVSRITVHRDSVEFAHRISDSLEDAPRTQRTVSPTNAPELVVLERGEPRYIKLPPAGTRCPHSGMSRSGLNRLILPSEANGFQAPVESVNRRDGAGRLISWASLKAYLERRDQSEVGAS